MSRGAGELLNGPNLLLLMVTSTPGAFTSTCAENGSMFPFLNFELTEAYQTTCGSCYCPPVLFPQSQST